MGRVKFDKPTKKNDRDLMDLICQKIQTGEYIFKIHAKERLRDRGITDIEVLDILEGLKGRRRKRNKSKDKYDEGFQDWNYCIEGNNLDGIKIRIIVSFEGNLMPIITVIRIEL